MKFKCGAFHRRIAVVLIAFNCKIVITSSSVDESLLSDYSNESYSPVLSHGTVYFSRDRKRKPSDSFF